jgi:hypothetical protein
MMGFFFLIKKKSCFNKNETNKSNNKPSESTFTSKKNQSRGNSSPIISTMRKITVKSHCLKPISSSLF